MLAMTTLAWYRAVCVYGAIPVRSPAAQTRPRSVVACPVAVAVVGCWAEADAAVGCPVGAAAGCAGAAAAAGCTLVSAGCPGAVTGCAVAAPGCPVTAT